MSGVDDLLSELNNDIAKALLEVEAVLAIHARGYMRPPTLMQVPSLCGRLIHRERIKSESLVTCKKCLQILRGPGTSVFSSSFEE